MNIIVSNHVALDIGIPIPADKQRVFLRSSSLVFDFFIPISFS